MKRAPAKHAKPNVVTIAVDARTAEQLRALAKATGLKHYEVNTFVVDTFVSLPDDQKANAFARFVGSRLQQQGASA